MAVRNVVIVAFSGVQPLDITGPHEVFATANAVLAAMSRPDRYELVVAGREAGPVRAESGLRLYADAFEAVGAEIDTLVIPGGDGVHAAAGDRQLVGWLSQQRPRRVATVCTGPFLAAAAGLLTGKRVTTHWARAQRLRRRYPDLQVDPEPVYICDGDVWSSAGVTAGIDLTLALVRDDVGAEVAQTVARRLVMFLHRPANQSQFAAPVWVQRAADNSVRKAQDIIDARPGDDHRVGALAARVAMSERHFQRRFVEQVGMTPGRYVAQVRLEAARRALEESDDTVVVIASRTGFGSAESMRRAFTSRLGTSPGSYRRRFTVKGTNNR